MQSVIKGPRCAALLGSVCTLLAQPAAAVGPVPLQVLFGKRAIGDVALSAGVPGAGW